MEKLNRKTRIKVRDVELFERLHKTRLPFRFGKAVVNHAPQLFARLVIEDEKGNRAEGVSAELLVPKWFDKNPEFTHEENFEELRNSVRLAASLYLDANPSTTFDLFLDCYDQQRAQGQQQGMAPLTAGFGQAFLDRAVADGLCRLEGVSFYQAVGANMMGIHANHSCLADLDGYELDRFLATLKPKQSINVRHTVGFLDPLTDQENTLDVDDGLPVTLQQCISTYGYRYYKVLVTGSLESDLARVAAVARLLDSSLDNYVASLDGSEQFQSLEHLVEFLIRLRDHADTARFFTRLHYIEQPIHRDRADTIDLHEASEILPVVLDEGDASLDAFPKAQALGYRGVSSKSCKGIYKSLLNAARCQMHSASGAFMTGEDLTMQPGIAMQQDMALVAAIGLDNVQRNGHHYVRGFQGADEREQQDFLAAHEDLYEDSGGIVHLKITNGKSSIASLDQLGFAHITNPDFTTMKQVSASFTQQEAH